MFNRSETFPGSGDHLPGWNGRSESEYILWFVLKGPETSQGQVEEMMHQFQNCSSSFLLHELLPTAQARKTSFRAQLMTELKWHRSTKALFFVCLFFHKEICDLIANKQIHHIPKCEATKRHYSQQVI